MGSGSRPQQARGFHPQGLRPLVVPLGPQRIGTDKSALALDAALREGRLVSVVLDAPRHLDPSLTLEEFRCRGLNCSSTPYRTSDLGVPTVRRRHCISRAMPPFSPDLEALGRLQVPTPPSLKLVPLDGWGGRPKVSAKDSPPFDTLTSRPDS